MTADIITVSPEIQSGVPVFTGTRVPVKILFDYLVEGDTIAEFLSDFPSVSKHQVIKVLRFMEHIYTFNSIEDYAQDIA